jgi:hypothetical protein
MEMYDPIKGKLRRTHYDGVFLKFAMSEKDFSVQAKIGYVQVCSVWSKKLHCTIIHLTSS